MPRRAALQQYSKDELVHYILALEKSMADIEPRLNQPRRSARNSPRAPSRDEKPNKPRRGKAGKTGKGGWAQVRLLEPNPDRTVTAPASNCPSCGDHVGPAHQALKGRYDRIEIPPVRPEAPACISTRGRVRAAVKISTRGRQRAWSPVRPCALTARD